MADGGGDGEAIGDLGVSVAEQLHAEQSADGAVVGDQADDAMAARIVGLVVIGGGFDNGRIEPGRASFVVARPGTTPAACPGRCPDPAVLCCGGGWAGNGEHRPDGEQSYR